MEDRDDLLSGEAFPDRLDLELARRLTQLARSLSTVAWGSALAASAAAIGLRHVFPAHTNRIRLLIIRTLSTCP
jgi:hypothetical protein